MKKLLFPAVFAIVFTVMPSEAGEVLSNVGTTWTNGRTFTPLQSTFSGLGFKTGSNAATIDALSFSLLAGNTPNPYPTITFSVFLYQMNGSHLPTGAALGSQSGLSATFSGTLPFIQQTFSYAADDLTGITSVQLQADTEYAIVLGNNNANDEYYWAQVSSPSYTTSDGYSWVGNVNSSNSGTSWTRDTLQGYIGSISVNAVPEPGTVVLLSLGLSAVLVFRPRRNRISR